MTHCQLFTFLPRQVKLLSAVLLQILTPKDARTCARNILGLVPADDVLQYNAVLCSDTSETLQSLRHLAQVVVDIKDGAGLGQFSAF